MSSENERSGGSIAIHIATPFIVAALCLGICIAAMIVPKDKIKVYLNLAFMDDLKTNPDDLEKGLVIRENEIVEDNTAKYSDKGDVVRPKYGEMYAVIKCDKFELDVPVYWGSDIDLFERGACQATGSKVIGDSGHSVISAHEDTFFSELSKLVPGDVVTINTNYGQFIYTVSENIEFKKTDNKYVTPSKTEKLTLYTCVRQILGSSTQRYAVVCEPVDSKFYS